MSFAQRRNRLTTHFSERIPVVKRYICRYHTSCGYVCPSVTHGKCLNLATDSVTNPNAQIPQNVLGTFRLPAMLTHNTVY